jgi:hypothetical protein
MDREGTALIRAIRKLPASRIGAFACSSTKAASEVRSMATNKESLLGADLFHHLPN